MNDTARAKFQWECGRCSEGGIKWIGQEGPVGADKELDLKTNRKSLNFSV